MSRNRYLNTKFWRDEYISELAPTEKLLYLYFLTSPDTNLSGIYEVPLKIMATDTGFDKDMILKILQRFEDDKKIFYISGYIVINNFLKHQNLENKSILKGIYKEFNNFDESLTSRLREVNGLIICNLINFDLLKEETVKDAILKIDNNDNSKIVYKNQFFKMTHNLIAYYENIYSSIDNITNEFKKMESWLISNPKNQKKDYKKFVNSWLQNSNEKQPKRKIKPY